MMLNKTAYKYILKDHMKSVITFYAVLMGIYILTGISILRLNTSGTLGGTDISAYIFLLVSGLVSFRESFLMLMQNSLSRKSIFASRLTATLTLAGIVAVADKALLLLGRLFFTRFNNIQIETIFEQIYAKQQITSNPFVIHLLMLAFNLLFYLCLFSMGYFISIVFYRCNKAGRVALGAGIPVGFFFLLPMVDVIIFKGKITIFIAKVLDFTLGISICNPLVALASFTLFFAASSGLCWLAMRKATVKK